LQRVAQRYARHLLLMPGAVQAVRRMAPVWRPNNLETRGDFMFMTHGGHGMTKVIPKWANWL